MTLDDHTVHDPGSSALPSLYTTEDLVASMGISVEAVHKLVREGKLPCVQVTAPLTGSSLRMSTQGLLRE